MNTRTNIHSVQNSILLLSHTHTQPNKYEIAISPNVLQLKPGTKTKMYTIGTRISHQAHRNYRF